MSDTGRVDMPKVACSDCGIIGCSWSHNGPLCPQRQSATFCHECYRIRHDTVKSASSPLPLGETDYFHRGNERFVHLVFSDENDQPPRARVDMQPIVARITTRLGVHVSFTTGSAHTCEFFWNPELNENRVNQLLNELRKEHPQLSISFSLSSTNPSGA